MAARKNRIKHDDRARESIRVSQLVNVLQADALARSLGKGKGPVTLTDGRRKSIEILLRKKLPDLSAVEHSGETQTNYVVHMPAPVKDLAEWTADNTQQEQQVSEDKPLTQH